MAHEHVGHRLELGLGIGRAGRVRRRVEDDPLGFRRDRLLQVFRLHLVAGRHGGDDLDRGAAGEQHHVRIAHPIGRRDDHLVARIERGDQRVVQHLLAAGADDDLRRLIVERVLALELARHRGLQFGHAVNCGIFRRLALADGADRRQLDVVGGVEIRLAGAEPDDVAARRFQRTRFIRNGDGRRRLDAHDLVRDEGHFRVSDLQVRQKRVLVKAAPAHRQAQNPQTFVTSAAFRARRAPGATPGQHPPATLPATHD